MGVDYGPRHPELLGDLMVGSHLRFLWTLLGPDGGHALHLRSLAFSPACFVPWQRPSPVPQSLGTSHGSSMPRYFCRYFFAVSLGCSNHLNFLMHSGPMPSLRLSSTSSCLWQQQHLLSRAALRLKVSHGLVSMPWQTLITLRNLFSNSVGCPGSWHRNQPARPLHGVVGEGQFQQLVWTTQFESDDFGQDFAVVVLLSGRPLPARDGKSPNPALSGRVREWRTCHRTIEVSLPPYRVAAFVLRYRHHRICRRLPPRTNDQAAALVSLHLDAHCRPAVVAFRLVPWPCAFGHPLRACVSKTAVISSLKGASRCSCVFRVLW